MELRFDRGATVLAAAILMAYASVSDAQGTGAAGKDAGRAATTATQPAAGAAKDAAPSRGAMQAAVRDVRMSRLIGMDVHNGRGERLGDVNDVIVDPASGRVAYVVVGAGGFLGIGEKLSAFPMSSFKVAFDDMGARGARTSATGTGVVDRAARAMDNDGVRGDAGRIGSDPPTAARAPANGTAATAPADGTRTDRGAMATDRPPAGSHTTAAGQLVPGADADRGLRLVLDSTPERLKDAPNFDRDQWPDWNDATFRSSVDRAAGVTPRNGAAMPAKEGQARTTASQGMLARASQLMDADVHDRQNEDIGDVEDLVVDVRDGRVRYAVVEFERGWFEADKLVAIPMNSLRASREPGELVFQGDRSRLERAPNFDRTAWPDLNSPRYRGDVDRYLSSWSGGAMPGTATTAQPTDRTRGSTAARGGAAGGGTTDTAPASGAGTGAGASR